jgi:SAM-dependent methyltransferase
VAHFNNLRQTLRRRRSFARLVAATPEAELLRFTCNLCGKPAAFPLARIGREVESCAQCGSTSRFRSAIHVLSLELFGESIPATQFPRRLDITGLGLSDCTQYPKYLKGKLTYRNTFFHKEPFLDITADGAATYGKFDFLISSEVFEHIPPPVERGFRNMAALLKPSGVLIFTVPFYEGETTEHFPRLHNFRIEQQDDQQSGAYTLHNTTAGGEAETFTDLIFHGGPGSTLEMRKYGLDTLLRNFADAGFAPPRIYSDPVPWFGIVHTDIETGGLGPLLWPPWSVRLPS